ncbi:MAG: alginate export family protein, partial [Planctomycetota bacterium]
SGLALSETLYAARVGASGGGFELHGLAGATPEGTTIDFDSSRPEFTTDTNRFFWGVLAEYTSPADCRPYVFFLDQSDNNNASFGPASEFFYDSSYAGIGATGQFTGQWFYNAEIVKEFGEGASNFNFAQTREDIDAWAARFGITYLPRRARRHGCRLGLEVLLATGDDDRSHSANTVGGNTSGTDDEGFNAFGYANTGLALAPALSNLLSLRLSASAFPLAGSRPLLRRLRVGVDLFLLSKFDDDAPNNFTTLPGESFIGTETDLAIEWQIFSDLHLDIRYGIFVPGGAVPDSDPRHFFYIGGSYGF